MRRLASNFGSVPFVTAGLMEPWTLTGHFSLLVDETMKYSHDVYFFNICFSPDGKLLAAGATDTVIRVRSGSCILHDRVPVSVLQPRNLTDCDFRGSRFGISPRGKSTTHSEVTLGVSTR